MIYYDLCHCLWNRIKVETKTMQSLGRLHFHGIAFAFMPELPRWVAKKGQKEIADIQTFLSLISGKLKELARSRAERTFHRTACG
ncbi:hypothetical protein V1522DRAFT_415917 [Lipomyces starkeyi]